jgi:hypothetical protein
VSLRKIESLEKRAGTFKFLFVPFLLVARRVKAIYTDESAGFLSFPSQLFKKVRLLSQMKKMKPKLSSNLFSL